LETLLQRLAEEKERETHRYFNSLAGNVIPSDQMDEQQQPVGGARGGVDRSPIETVFTLNLRESLLSF
jgi:hypothetical protein